MAVGVNIYPPVLNTYMPAYLKEGEVVDGIKGYKIYLSLSDYNVYDEVKNNVQVTLVRQDTNKNVFSATAAAAGIHITSLKQEEDRYYIILAANDLNPKYLLTDIYYKVQIRFTSNKDQDGEIIPQQSNPIDSNWLTKNLDCFSEWSTVCLIKGIEQPTMKITGLSPVPDVLYNTIKSPSYDINGTFTCGKEVLKSYRIELYDASNNMIETSGDILTNQNNKPNNIKYSFTTYLDSTSLTIPNYYMKLYYTTNNLYTNNNNPLRYNLLVNYNSLTSNINILTNVDDENGFIQLKLTQADGGIFTNPIIVKRASSKDNFKTWHTIHKFKNGNSQHIFNDFTVESGIMYKYYAYYDGNGFFTPSKITEPTMVLLDFLLLSTKSCQLKLFLDGKITGMNYTRGESKTDTIGGKYPIVRINGNLHYRTFNIEGTIHSLMDQEGYFTSRADIYKDNQSVYDKYNEKHNVQYTRDFVYEKFFKEKVKNFLFQNNAILLRTPSEGNIIVKLISTNFTPNAQLNYLIYKFNTSAVEIDEDNYDNLIKYNLINLEGENDLIANQNLEAHTVMGKNTIKGIDSLSKEELSNEI